MSMTFEQFEQCILAVQKDNEYISALYDLGYTHLSEYLNAETMLMVLLKDIMNDEDDFISWWCYEKDFGRDKSLQAKDIETGEVIPMDTIYDLWCFLTGDSAKEQEESSEEESTDNEEVDESDEAE